MNIELLIRDNIRTLKPYSSARHEFDGEASVYLDANESPFGIFNRYPDPLQKELKQKISEIKNVPVQNIFLGNGSDEAIDLLIRIFCEPGWNKTIICPPTYGMYEVCAAINDIRVRSIPLTETFQLDTTKIMEAMDAATNMIFICSPNNPTGNTLTGIEKILQEFEGIVVVDEAYIDFSDAPSFINLLGDFPNLVVLQTFSKARGLAGLRIGMAFAHEQVISCMNKVKYPYNISTGSQQLALKTLSSESFETNIKTIRRQRKILSDELKRFAFTETVYPSDANFLLVKMKDPHGIYGHLRSHGIIVRERMDCLRITVGTAEENKLLIETLKKI